MILDMRQLASFVLLADELSFSRAAKRANMTQPGMSQHIQRLENTLGVRLVERDRKTVRLTEAGRILLEGARQILECMHATADAVRTQGCKKNERLAIGYVPIAISSPMTSIIQKFQDENPGFDVRMREASSMEQRRQLLKGELQLGFLTPQDAAEESSEEICQLEICREQIIACVPERHPLAKRESISVGDLRNEPLITLPPECAPRWHRELSTRCRQAGFEPRIVQHAMQTQSIIALVAAGVGISFTIASFSPLPHQGVIMKAIDDMSWDVPIVLTWSRDDADAAVRQFVGIAREHSADTSTAAIPWAVSLQG
ncbi:MAG: LysR family transcriptional regulator [Hyphomonadaceae bacterium]